MPSYVKSHLFYFGAFGAVLEAVYFPVLWLPIALGGVIWVNKFFLRKNLSWKS